MAVVFDSVEVSPEKAGRTPARQSDRGSGCDGSGVPFRNAARRSGVGLGTSDSEARNRILLYVAYSSCAPLAIGHTGLFVQQHSKGVVVGYLGRGFKGRRQRLLSMALMSSGLALTGLRRRRLSGDTKGS